MKRCIALLLAALILLGMASCKKTESPTESGSGTPSPSGSSTEPTESSSPGVVIGPSTSPSVTPSDPPNMYSSYADMVSFDPATGNAKFDFWDRLTGDAAVDWLVDHEGYTQAQAEALVDDFADSEFVKKNSNSQLRTVDLSETDVYMLQYPYGYDSAPDPDPELTSFSALCDLYEDDPDILLEMAYYYVTVNSGGSVTKVSQCYQP